MRWGDDEKELLQAVYSDTPNAVLALRLGRLERVIGQQARKLGLAKSEEFMRSPAAGRFRSGGTPVNKGMRHPAGWAPGRMAETQFKKGVRTGCAAKNWRPIGTVLPDSDGYLRIKVREGMKGEAYGFGNVRIWPCLHRHIWEQKHGPLPAGHALVFKDRNRANCQMDNLELLSRADLMRRNTLHNLPPQLVEVIQLRGVLNRKIRRREREKQDVGPAQPPLCNAGSAER